MKQLFITSVRDFEKNTMGTVEMREMPMPEPAEDEVRIKIIYSSICGSDAHTLTGHLGEFEEGTKAMLPMTFGHELKRSAIMSATRSSPTTPNIATPAKTAAAGMKTCVPMCSFA